MAPSEEESTGTHLIQPRLPERAVQRFRLTVVEGANRGLVASSEGAEFLVGTALGNQLRLSDATVSRHHCSLVWTPRGVLLRDLGSSNGTRVHGCDVETVYLKAPTTFTVGLSTIVFDTLQESVRERLSLADRWGRVLGQSSSMRRIFADMEWIAGSDSTVLLEGETGTGKGLLADAIHQASPRRGQPLVVVDCGSIPRSLIESELFGHEKGAFTGAHAQRRGAFEQAQRGTILLDEIGELPLDMQPKLLRLLEERVLKRVGGSEAVRLDVRILAATNRDLRREVNQNRFRSDLFYRLNTVTIRVPPLRERAEDVALLAEHFHTQFAPSGGDMPADLLASLKGRDWPGNVRELRNAVERAVLLGASEALPDAEAEPAWAPAAGAFVASLSFREAKERVVGAWELGYLRDLLARSGGNISRAARSARTDRNYLRELLHRHGLTARDEEGDASPTTRR